MNPSIALKPWWALFVIALATAVPTGSASSAPSAELAKKCRDMMIKAHPPRPPGSRTGNATQQQEYFRTCVARNGKMDNVVTPTEGRGHSGQ
jgi:hypothetical protein